MPESVTQRVKAMPDLPSQTEMWRLLQAVQADLAALRATINTHVHSGVTVGAGNTGAIVTPAAALNTTP